MSDSKCTFLLIALAIVFKMNLLSYTLLNGYLKEKVLQISEKEFLLEKGLCRMINYTVLKNTIS